MTMILIYLEWLNLIRLYVKMSTEVFRCWWVKPHIRTHVRDLFGAYDSLFQYFILNDHESFQKIVRISVDQFEELHDLISHRLQKRSLRQPLSTRLRLAVTLWWVIWAIKLRNVIAISLIYEDVLSHWLRQLYGV